MPTKQKPSKKLKAFLNTDKNPTRVLGSVERWIIAEPVDSDRPTNVIHPSDMAKSDWCHRATYFELLGYPPAPDKYPPSLRMKNVFKNGHDVHERWQALFERMGRLYGVWECSKCKKQAWALSKDISKICTHKTARKRYMEVRLDYPKLRIRGHADGWLFEFGEPLLLEIKSVGVGTVRFENPGLFYECDGNMTKIWEKLDAPFFSHIQQVQIYLKLIELLGLPNPPQEAVLIYENKGTQEVKEFVIPKSDFSVNHLFEAAEMIVSAIDNGVPPTCNIDSVNGCHNCNHHSEENNGISTGSTRV